MRLGKLFKGQETDDAKPNAESASYQPPSLRLQADGKEPDNHEKMKPEEEQALTSGLETKLQMIKNRTSFLSSESSTPSQPYKALGATEVTRIQSNIPQALATQASLDVLVSKNSSGSSRRRAPTQVERNATLEDDNHRRPEPKADYVLQIEDDLERKRREQEDNVQSDVHARDGIMRNATPTDNLEPPSKVESWSHSQRSSNTVISHLKSMESWIMQQRSSPANSQNQQKSHETSDDFHVKHPAGQTFIDTKVPASEGTAGWAQHLLFRRNYCYALLLLPAILALALTVKSMNHILRRFGNDLAKEDLSDFYKNYSTFRINSSAPVYSYIDWSVNKNVAFIGGSYFYVNDIPRLLQALSDDHVYQQSVIHSSSGSLPSLLMRGNGMYYAWQTQTAFLEQYQYYASNNGNNRNGNNNKNQQQTSVNIYDYGLCTVAQILLGKDEILSYDNKDGAYINDYRNPCIMDEGYFYYSQNEVLPLMPSFDYVVLVDQAKRMAAPEAREESVYALVNAYGPLIAQLPGTIPVLVDTHSFWSDQSNMTGLQSITYFQTLIYNGVQEYAAALASVLPEDQSPLVVPIGVAYLTVYEDSYSRWLKLFDYDSIHSSVHGSYLFATVLYTTLFGHLPPTTHDSNSTALFENCRRLFSSLYNSTSATRSRISYPSQSEVEYYRKVAQLVVLKRYLPSSLRKKEN